MKEVTWQTASSDSRWVASGRDIIGYLEMPAGLIQFLEDKKAELGEEFPADLTWQYKW